MNFVRLKSTFTQYKEAQSFEMFNETCFITNNEAEKGHKNLTIQNLLEDLKETLKKIIKNPAYEHLKNMNNDEKVNKRMKGVFFRSYIKIVECEIYVMENLIDMIQKEIESANN